MAEKQIVLWQGASYTYGGKTYTNGLVYAVETDVYDYLMKTGKFKNKGEPTPFTPEEKLAEAEKPKRNHIVMKPEPKKAQAPVAVKIVNDDDEFEGHASHDSDAVEQPVRPSTDGEIPDFKSVEEVQAYAKKVLGVKLNLREGTSLLMAKRSLIGKIRYQEAQKQTAADPKKAGAVVV
jgi:hypothetical protein